MKASRVIIIASCLASASPVLAQSRPSTTSMTCAAANAFVRSRGAVVLGTGRDLFDRYVSDQSQCQRGQSTLPAFAPTTDNAQCMIGWRCVEVTIEDR